MYTINSVYPELATLIPQYRADNAWAIRWFEPVNADNILNAWRLYKATSRNALGLLLLGEEGMRKKVDLLINFGLTSAHGPEDDEAAFLGAVGVQRNLLGIPGAPQFVGPGSILSDRKWNPLLNDAWLLGGVHARQDFHLVTEGVGSVSFDLVATRRAAFGPAAPGYQRTPIQKWKNWFLRNPQILFESWGPRVFAREAIGLMAFGYEPVFSNQQLGFRCVDPQAATGATFRRYLAALSAVNFQLGSAGRNTVLSALSNFIFGDPNLLSAARALP
jgi:hypothetical protein